MPETDFLIRIPEGLCAELGVSVGQSVTVGFGGMTARCRVAPRGGDLAKTSKTVWLSEQLAKKLGVPADYNLGVIRSGDKLKVGPLIGVLAKQYRNGTFGQDSFYRKLLLQLKKQNCVGMVFTLQGIDWERQMINGFWLAHNGSSAWKRKWFPFPDVVYNRYFRKDGEPWSYPILHRMSKYGVKSFNAAMGSKWKIHRFLSRYPEINKHLPETRVLTGSSTLNTMLQKHRQVYIKPAGGCQGHGISRVRRMNGTYLYQGTKDDTEFKYNDLTRVVRKAKSNSHSKVLLVQQGITTPSRSGHFDVRVMVQKDGSNTWHVSGMAARVGIKGRVTTNLHAGGKAAKLDGLLAECGFSSDRTAEIISNIRNLALQISEKLETHAHPIGEIGLDFIIDAEGNVWFLEANSKPGRKAFSKMESNGEDRLTIIRPILYARYLAGF